MNTLDSHPSLGKIRLLLITAVVLAPQILFAQWNATIGAQTTDKGRQALAFLPNEIWIHAGDKITWTFATDEPHTLTFLTENQIRNPFFVGCPGYSPDNSPFDGSTCVSTPPMFHGQTFTVIFPATGNFKFSCLFHENMTGAVHVLAASESLPHDQAFYDNQAKSDRRALITKIDDTGHLTGHGTGPDVIAGVGRVVATTGGSHTVSILRFMQKRVTIHVGDSVEWGNDDPITPHTITFGEEPADPVPPSPNVIVDSDGARHVVLNSTSDSAHSGFIQAAPQDRIGLPQSPLGVTRFRVTFTKRGTYHYICALHDELGMVGNIVVLP